MIRLDIDRLHKVLNTKYHDRGEGKTTARLVQMIQSVQMNPDIKSVVAIISLYRDIWYIRILLENLQPHFDFTLRQVSSNTLEIDGIKIRFITEEDEYQIRGLKDYLLVYLRHWD